MGISDRVGAYFSDTFNSFNEERYTAEIKKLSNNKLLQLEIKKIQNDNSKVIGFLTGLGLAPFTSGLSLIGSGLAFRRGDIIEQELTIIRKEIASRGLEVHVEKAGDVVKPVIEKVVIGGIVDAILPGADDILEEAGEEVISAAAEEVAEELWS